MRGRCKYSLRHILNLGKTMFVAVVNTLHVQLNLSFQGSCGCGTDSRGQGSPVLQTHSAQFPPHGTVAWQPVETDELPTSEERRYIV